MGRGRAKAKQTKVARELKYSSPNTDYAALQRELANGGGFGVTAPPVKRHEVADDDDIDTAAWDSYGDDEDDDEEQPPSRAHR